MNEVLIFAGSAEGHALARALPRARAVLPAPPRTDRGGVSYEIVPHVDERLVARGAGPVVLATHPGDGALRDALPAACAAAGRPLLHLCRPPWRPGPQDRWHPLEHAAALPGPIPRGARVFVGLGREMRDHRARLAGRYLVVRQLDPDGSPWPGQGHYLAGTAPFSVAQEIETLRAERIDWLLVRNAGGPGGWPKLAAARALGLPVAMLARPAPMAGVPVAESVEAALAWPPLAEFCEDTAGVVRGKNPADPV
jgi:precorrin-6A/cobalt-precorrin-6A reductase